MYEKKREKHHKCPLEYSFAIFDGKWNLQVFCTLVSHGSLRYSEFREKIEGLSDPALAATLKFLGKNGIVRRTAYNEMPMRVEYSLTDKGKSAIPFLQGLCVWARKYTGVDEESLMEQCQSCGCMQAQTESNN